MKCPSCDAELVLQKYWSGRVIGDKMHKFCVYRCEREKCERPHDRYFKNIETDEPIRIGKEPVAEQELHILERCES